MRLLGAILAGGVSRRFGSDKAAARIDGVALLDRVAAALSARCAAVIVAGRDWPGLVRVDDVPRPGLGPLGGLSGALAYARHRGYDAILSCGCDLPALPVDLVGQLGSPDAIVRDQPTIGMWWAGHADALARHVEADPQRSIRGWAATIGARFVTLDAPVPNVNTTDDLARVAAEIRRTGGPRSSR